MSAQAARTDTVAKTSATTDWIAICELEDIVPDTGVFALVGNRQIAIFRLADDSLYAIDNFDPISGASVLSRGIVGDIKGEVVVASPVFKQHFRLSTGLCVEEDTAVPIYAVKLDGSTVFVSTAD